MSINQKLYDSILTKALFLPVDRNTNWWDDKEVQETFRAACKNFMSKGCEEQLPINEDKGIVICGGGKYLPCTFVNVKAIRNFGCQLPITIFHYNNYEIRDSQKRMFDGLNVNFVNIEKHPNMKSFRKLRSYAIKIFAICYSPYKHVMLTDADNFPSTNLEYLFDSEAYKNNQFILFNDINHIEINKRPRNLFLNPFNCEVFGVPYNGYESTDTGLIYVNKQKWMKELILTKWFNEFNEYYYEHNLGDKDLFLFAWKLFDSPYYFNPNIPKHIDHKFLLHIDNFGKEISVHMCGKENKIKNDKFIFDNMTHGNLYHEYTKEYYTIHEKKLRLF